MNTYILFHTYREWYEPDAVMLNEESNVISGLLVGLNAIDYNVMMKGEEFDRSVSYWILVQVYHVLVLSYRIVYAN